MATVAERLAESLKQLKLLQDAENFVVLHGTDQLSRVHLTRLLSEGWLKEVIKGWYIASRPGMEGDTTDWYTSYWAFISKYCASRFGKKWSLTAEQSLDLHSGDTTVPMQTIIRNPEGNNNVTQLLYGTNLFNLKANLPVYTYIHPEYGVRMYSLAEALVFVSPSFFRQHPISARTCLQMVKDESEIYGILADEGASKRAGRLVGAFRNIGRDKIANNILGYMKRLGYDIREEDPFEDKDAHNALVARGYYQAFLAVRNTIVKIAEGTDAGTAVDEDHGNWYFEMWQPMVAAGLYKPSSIVGYRNRPVYIRGSRHTPMNYEAVRDAMPEYFRLLREEKHPAVRAILGHFMFGFIHPYNDGNGRMSRFIMNAMLSTGGYTWTIIPVEKRKVYMEALEKASIEGDIADFTRLIADLI